MTSTSPTVSEGASSEGANRLPILADEVKSAATDIRIHATMTLHRALDAGAALLEAKALIPHGGWIPWLETVGVADRTARVYMQLARHRAAVELQSAAAADLTIRGALDRISGPLADGRGHLGCDPSGTEAWIVPSSVSPGYSFVTVIKSAADGFDVHGLSKPVRADAVELMLDAILDQPKASLSWTDLHIAPWPANLFLAEPELHQA